jgi:iron-sulfur cluster assembly accessory protein
MNISITKSAWNKMKDIILKSSNKYGFIYSCSSGGCNGFNFELNLLKEEDYKKYNQLKFITVLSNDNTQLYIEPLSEMYLVGTTIDYIKEDYKTGIYESKFKFNVDKNLMNSCGCGVSFSPK